MSVVAGSLPAGLSIDRSAGAAPGSDATTVTVGRSMSGNCWIFIALKPAAFTIFAYFGTPSRTIAASSRCSAFA